MWVLLKLPRFGGANYASDHDNRSRHRQIRVSGSRHRRGRQSDCQAAIEASPCPRVQAAAMLGWYRGVRIIPPLVTRDQSTWPQGPPDATCLCEALRQATEERRGGCRGDLRGSEATDD